MSGMEDTKAQQGNLPALRRPLQNRTGFDSLREKRQVKTSEPQKRQLFEI